MYNVETKVFPHGTIEKAKLAIMIELGLDFEENELFDGDGNILGSSFTVFEVESEEVDIIRSIEERFEARDVDEW